ncbi:MAG: hypothetical protein R2865_08075 [Deinococcales bacterium]
MVEALRASYASIWQKTPQIVGMGGSIPILGMFYQELAMPMVLFGFGIGDNQHAPNEFIYLREFRRSIDTAIDFYHRLGRISL